MTRHLDMTGSVFGQWTVLVHCPPPPGRRETEAWWLCRCSCGTERPVRGATLRNGTSRSCGCAGTSPALGLREVARLRKSLGMTAAKLAAAAGICPATLSQIESGHTKDPSVYTVARIARTLGVNIEDLLGDIDDAD